MKLRRTFFEEPSLPIEQENFTWRTLENSETIWTIRHARLRIVQLVVLIFSIAPADRCVGKKRGRRNNVRKLMIFASSTSSDPPLRVRCVEVTL